MKLLKELLGVKKFQDQTADEVIDYLKSHFSSLKPLGQGASGVALTDGANVYKFWLVDSAYDDFIQYCMKHQSNPLLPKLKSGIKTMPAFFLRHKDSPDVVKYVKMERLTHALKSDCNVMISKKLERWIDLEHLYYLIESENGEPEDVYLNLIDEFKDSQIDVDDLTDELKLLVETLCDIYELTQKKNYKKKSHHPDLHLGNVMMRDKQLVIIDPIANVDDLNLNATLSRFGKKLNQIGKAGRHVTSGSHSA